MSSNLDLLYYAAAVVFGYGVPRVARSFFRYRQAKHREESVTVRLGKALEGTDPRERPDIIRALGGTEDEPQPPEPESRTPLDWFRQWRQKE